MEDYREFLNTKKIDLAPSGFEISIDEINNTLFPFQKYCVKLAIEKGKYCLFQDCGLGKTIQQVEWARLIYEKTGKDILILAPLAVAKQTINESKRLLNYDINYCRAQSQVKPGVNITNYEMLDKFEPEHFGGIVLDESSILKSYTGKTKKEIISAFKTTPYKLCCTATPSPNDHMEILNHAAFLGIMESHEALAIWFINDTQNMGTYRLKKHAIDDFWKWVSSWAISLQFPSDLGKSFDQRGFNLPKLNVKEEIVESESKPDDGFLFNVVTKLNATNYQKERRSSVHAKVDRIKELINSTDEITCIWVDTNYEADLLKESLPDAIEVRGNDSTQRKEQVAIDFANGKIKTLISKPSIFGFGMNFQVCHNVIFCGISFSYESFYQTVRRFYRFGQSHEVSVSILISENEKQILDTLHRKQKQYDTLKKNMYQAIIQKQQEINNTREYKMEYVSNTKETKYYKLILGDSTEEIKNIPDNSVDIQIFSPPFSSLYIYSDSYRDMGNAKNDDEFFKHFEYLIPELYRIQRPGRICCVHCKDLVDYKNRDGRSGLRDFPGEIVVAMEKHGWKYHSKVTIWKDPVTEMERTKTHGLLHKQVCKDSSFSRQGLPDYLIMFRKWDNEELEIPVTRENEKVRFHHWPGTEQPKQQKEKNENTQEYRDSIRYWQRYASPVWFDIDQMNVLNIKQAKDDKDEKHICPLQLDVIERCIELWSNPGDTVFSPFMGIGSEGYISMKMNRKFIGIELKESYFEHAIKNIDEAIKKRDELELPLFQTEEAL